LTYSLIIDENHRLIHGDFQKTYETLCSGLVLGLKLLGIPAEFRPINDIVVEGKKISGNAQTRGMNIVHQHGTILREVDPSLMFTVLKVPSEKIRDKMIKFASERVTSINGFLKSQLSFEELKEALTNGFSEAFKVELVPQKTSKFESQLAAKLRKEKYGTREWNFKR